MDEIEQEFKRALMEGRQPLCPGCGKPLVIEQDFYENIAFRWDAQAKRYYKVTIDKGTERPRCKECDTEFRIFIGESKVMCDLGLYY
jgi:hypothetical protein